MKKSIQLSFTCLSLLLVTFLSNIQTHAQVDDTIRTIIISEIRLAHMSHSYVELANVGDFDVNLKDFELGSFDPWGPAYGEDEDNYFRLPDHILKPGETFVVANVEDYSLETDVPNTYEEI